MRILIVEDHEIVRRGLKQLLTEAFADAGFEEAATVPEARQKLVGDGWDLLLLDINLMGGSGLELLAEVKKTRPSLPVLMLSAYPEKEYAIRSLRMGASGYLTKTSLAEEMVRAVRKVVGGGRYVSATLAETLAEVVGNPQPGPPHETLSPRELEVLRQVALGKTLKEIAADLSLSEKTIATYRARISEKLGISTNVELTRYALKHRLVE
ncbi:MAG TPA: response regulator transcription factor [Thermoanaerobaculia bacterium]|nr:response regulator transcription factor [Thermoanaerobaculia bacterium]